MSIFLDNLWTLVRVDDSWFGIEPTSSRMRLVIQNMSDDYIYDATCVGALNIPGRIPGKLDVLMVVSLTEYQVRMRPFANVRALRIPVHSTH